MTAHDAVTVEMAASLKDVLFRCYQCGVDFECE